MKSKKKFDKSEEKRKNQRYSVIGGSIAGRLTKEDKAPLTYQFVDVSSSGLGLIFTDLLLAGSFIYLHLNSHKDPIKLQVKWIVPVESSYQGASFYRGGAEVLDDRFHLVKLLSKSETLLLEDIS